MISRQEEKINVMRAMDAYQVGNPHETNSFSGFVNWVSSIPNKLFGSISAAMIVPATHREPAYLDNVQSFEKAYKVTMTPYAVITHDHAQLDSIEVTPRGVAPYEFVVIKFNGNYMFYEDRLSEMAHDAQALKATVIGFNYRHVGHSKGVLKSEDQLLIDGIAQVQRLLDQGVKPEHILLDGISLGGGVATLVAYHFFLQGIKLFLFNDRSFSDISKTVAGMICKNSYECTRTSFESTASFLLKASAWDVDVGNAYIELPRSLTAHMYVDKESSAYPDNVGDQIIDHDASLHEAVKEVDPGYKMLVNRNLFNNGHNAPRKNLILADSKEEMNGEKVFYNFVAEKRAGKR